MAKRPTRGTRRRRAVPPRGGRAGATAGHSRAILHAVAEQLPGMIWMGDARGGIAFVNERLGAFLGATGESLRGTGWDALIHEDDRPQAAEAVSAAIRARQPFTVECRMRDHDGDYRWVAFSGSPRTAAGRYAGYLGTITDSTPRRNAEHAATLATSRLRALVAAMRDVCVGVGPEEEIVCWNREAERFTGIPATETIGHTLQAVLTPETLARVRTMMGDRDTDRNASGLEHLVFRARPDRSLHARVVAADTMCMLLAAPDRDDSPSAVEQRLRESEERYRTFVENSNEGIWRIEVMEPIPVGLPAGEQLRRILDHAYVAECNASLARIFGYPETRDIIGVRFKDLVRADITDDLHPLMRFVLSGYRLMNYEAPLHRQDGVIRYVLHNVVGTIEHGALVRAWGSLSDVTERKDAERELRLLAHTITSTRDCVSLTDLNDRVLFVNDAFLSTYGFSEDELLGHDIRKVRPEGPDQGDLSEIKEKTLNGGWYGEIINCRADGSRFPVELWTSVVRNDEGEPVAMVGVARDITARKKAEEELRASLREKEVLLKEIHHRVKNNLQVISSLLSLQSEYLRDEEMIKVLKESQNRVKSMALIHEKLYQSRNLAEIDFGDYLRELTAQLIRSYGVGTHNVQLNVNAARVLLAVDRAIPCGIIVNELVTNALKYAFPDGRDGTIDVDLQPVSAERVRLTVRDDGVGIPETIDVATSDSLGLTLVRMLAEQVQGEMTMQPHGPGADFTLTFRKA